MSEAQLKRLDMALTAANIQQAKAQSIRVLVDGGFDPDTVVLAVTTNDFTQLKKGPRL